MIITTFQGAFVLAENSITKHWFRKETASRGLLTQKHYKEVEASLDIAGILKNGQTQESIKSYYHEDKDLEGKPTLVKCLDALENQLNLMTDGEYNAVVSEMKSGHYFYDYKYLDEVQRIWGEIENLRDGRYYENEIFHRPGIPRIETTGARIVEKIMDLIWKLDNDLPSFIEEMRAVMEGMNADKIL